MVTSLSAKRTKPVCVYLLSLGIIGLIYICAMSLPKHKSEQYVRQLRYTKKDMVGFMEVNRQHVRLCSRLLMMVLLEIMAMKGAVVQAHAYSSERRR